MRSWNTVWICTFSALLYLLTSPGLAVAQTHPAGADHYRTDVNPTGFDFSANPIPADFFYVGSDPFAGTACLVGLPAPSLPGMADTVVQRLADLNLPAPFPSNDTVPIEVTELHLVSCAPITVTGTMSSQDWSIDIGPSAGDPQPGGSIFVQKDDPNGGGFDVQVPSNFELVFTRVSDSAQQTQQRAATLVIQGLWTEVVPFGGYAGANDNFFPFPAQIVLQEPIPLAPPTLAGQTALAQLPPNLSQLDTTTWQPLAQEPMPPNLLDPIGANPFSQIISGFGNDTLVTTWTQTVTINRFGSPVSLGFGLLDSAIEVTESASLGDFYESAEQVFVTNPGVDPFLTTQLIMGGGLPSTMQLDLLDAVPGGLPDPFLNDFLTQVPTGEPLLVFEGPPQPIEIVSPLGVVIATNTMTPYQVTSAGPNLGVIDNAFGILHGNWNVLVQNVDGAPSPFLDVWVDLPQGRWKPHPSGWQFIVTGAPLPGPAGVLHNPAPNLPFVPSMSVVGGMLLASVLVGLGTRATRRR